MAGKQVYGVTKGQGARPQEVYRSIAEVLGVYDGSMPSL